MLWVAVLCVCVLIDRSRIQATAVMYFFPWVVGRYWSVETYYAAGGNPGAWAVDENLLRVCECHCSLARSLACPPPPHQIELFVLFATLELCECMRACAYTNNNTQRVFLQLALCHHLCVCFVIESAWSDQKRNEMMEKPKWIVHGFC